MQDLEPVLGPRILAKKAAELGYKLVPNAEAASSV
jgi:hypothetical protein